MQGTTRSNTGHKSRKSRVQDYIMSLPRFVSTNQPTFFHGSLLYFILWSYNSRRDWGWKPPLFSGATIMDEIGDGNLLYYLELTLYEIRDENLLYFLEL
jgi:hypothetical protein